GRGPRPGRLVVAALDEHDGGDGTDREQYHHTDQHRYPPAALARRGGWRRTIPVRFGLGRPERRRLLVLRLLVLRLVVLRLLVLRLVIAGMLRLLDDRAARRQHVVAGQRHERRLVARRRHARRRTRHARRRTRRARRRTRRARRWTRRARHHSGPRRPAPEAHLGDRAVRAPAVRACPDRHV